MRMSKGFFDASRPWALLEFIQKPCGRSKRYCRLIQKWLKARSIGGWEVVGDEGGDSARGGDLAAFSEHLSAYVLDQWVVWWRKRYAIRGMVNGPLRG